MEMKSDAYVSTCVHVLHVRVYLNPFMSTSNLNNTVFSFTISFNTNISSNLLHRKIKLDMTVRKINSI